MRKQILCLVCGLAFLGTAAAAAAGELSVTIANGRATVIAKDVPVRQILAEWAKVGATKVVGAERLPGGPVTLELVDVPEKEALDILLRTAAGYIAAPRPAEVAGASQYDRVIIMATSKPPAATADQERPFSNWNDAHGITRIDGEYFHTSRVSRCKCPAGTHRHCDCTWCTYGLSVAIG